MGIVVAFMDDLMFLSRIREAAKASGTEVRGARTVDQLQTAAVRSGHHLPRPRQRATTHHGGPCRPPGRTGTRRGAGRRFLQPRARGTGGRGQSDGRGPRAGPQRVRTGATGAAGRTCFLSRRGPDPSPSRKTSSCVGGSSPPRSRATSRGGRSRPRPSGDRRRGYRPRPATGGPDAATGPRPTRAGTRRGRPSCGRNGPAGGGRAASSRRMPRPSPPVPRASGPRTRPVQNGHQLLFPGFGPEVHRPPPQPG